MAAIGDKIRIGDRYYSKSEALDLFLQMGILDRSAYSDLYGRPVSWDEIFDAVRTVTGVSKQEQTMAAPYPEDYVEVSKTNDEQADYGLNITRYKVDVFYYCDEVDGVQEEESEDGMYVRYEDVLKLIAEGKLRIVTKPTLKYIKV